MRKFIVALALVSTATINGQTLPFTVVDNATAKLEFLDDLVVLTESGTYTPTGHSRRTEGGQVLASTIVESGTYTRTGTEITLRNGVDNTADYGTVDGSSLTVSHVGLAAKYAKQ